MESLQELLAKEGFERPKLLKNKGPVKSKDRITSNESIALPIYICHDRKSFDFSKQKPDKTLVQNGSSVLPSKKIRSKSERSNSKSSASDLARRAEPAIDEIAIRAIISILSGYIGQFIKDESFRDTVREKCYSCLSKRQKDSDNSIFANMELGIENIERLAEIQGKKKELKMSSLQNAIRLLSIVASLNSPKLKNGSTCGVPNSHLSSCAQLYLSIVYKLEKNDRISSRHLLQVFCDSPFLARTHLLPDLWEHFFLPHVLHLKVWYSKELEFIANYNSVERERRVKALSKVYNEQMDMGTTKFAIYYKEWLRVGVKAPPIPSVPLPSIPSYGLSGKKTSGFLSSHLSINKTLYQAVFGPTHRQSRSLELEIGIDGALKDTYDLGEEEKVDIDDFKLGSSVHSGMGTNRRLSSQNYENQEYEVGPETHKSDYLWLFMCRSEPTTGFVHDSHVGANAITRKPNTSFLSSNLSRAVATICTSDSLCDCEIAIRVVVKAWLDSYGDPIVETKLSKAPVIKGMLEILFTSEDDEILELAISILAELVTRNELNRQIILNSDPQLEIFMRLLSSNLFLKASVLLYLLKPKAKQMPSIEWVPLVLRVLEFGDKLQTLFTVQCRPHMAAVYLLNQLLTGFAVGRNLENAREVVSHGGLNLLVQRLELGNHHERMNAAMLISSCIRADGSGRHYLLNNIKKVSILELLILENQMKFSGCALSLLIELLCLNRRTLITKFLNGLKNDGGCLNTMHILLVYLRHAPLEQRPLVAAILLQLDLLGDPFQYSVYREEAVDAIIAALDCETCNEKVQEQSRRALLVLAGRFSYAGEALAETWLLKQAGFDKSSGDSFHGKEIVVDRITLSNEEENATEDWLKKEATVLLMSGNKRLLTALSESMVNGIPSLARASLVTVAWMSSSVPFIQDSSLRSMTCSILVPRLLETLNYERALEEKVLASLSLLNLVKNSECLPLLLPLDKELVGHLRNLTLMTWTAEELLSIAMNGFNHRPC